jgi:hypothetical protein
MLTANVQNKHENNPEEIMDDNEEQRIQCMSEEIMMLQTSNDQVFQ